MRENAAPPGVRVVGFCRSRPEPTARRSSRASARPSTGSSRTSSGCSAAAARSCSASSCSLPSPRSSSTGCAGLPGGGARALRTSRPPPATTRSASGTLALAAAAARRLSRGDPTRVPFGIARCRRPASAPRSRVDDARDARHTVRRTPICWRWSRPPRRPSTRPGTAEKRSAPLTGTSHARDARRCGAWRATPPERGASEPATALGDAHADRGALHPRGHRDQQRDPSQRPDQPVVAIGRQPGHARALHVVLGPRSRCRPDQRQLRPHRQRRGLLLRPDGRADHVGRRRR